jgi:photosystem II stability/assembly factor-like uncharacterized protein
VPRNRMLRYHVPMYVARLIRLAVCVALLVACTNQAAAVHTASKSPAPATPSVAAASPDTTPPPTNDNPLTLAAIQRVDARTGFVTGWTGTGLGLARTLDAGASWQRIAVPADRITTLRFIDANVGWAGGFIPHDVPQVACAQAAPPGTSACLGVVLRTIDGGRTWQQTLAIPDDGVNGDPVVQLQAIDAQVAWALTLACASPPAANPILKCPTDLRRTTDGGRTWTTLVSGQIVSIRFATASRGWLAMADPNGSFEVRFTNDGGSTWTSGIQTSSEIIGLDAASSQTAWAMTRDGGDCSASTCGKYELIRTLNGGLTWTSLGNPKPSTGNCAIGAIYGPLFASPTRGWLVLNLGAGGVSAPGGLLQTEDGGKTWHCTNTPPNTYFVSAADPNHIWVSSNQRGTEATTLYSSEDGGTTWHALDLGSLANGPVAPR